MIRPVTDIEAIFVIAYNGPAHTDGRTENSGADKGNEDRFLLVQSHVQIKEN